MLLRSRRAFQVLCLLFIRTTAALNYVGGFDSIGRCVGICTNTRNTPTCFDPLDTVCRQKKQLPGDWDYVMLDQLFLPQLCRDLQVGLDDTVSHQNVDIYPTGTQCNASRVSSTMTIHGLMPSYNTGYPACCLMNDTTRPNLPLDPMLFSKQHPEILEVMETRWTDPTAANAYQSLCTTLNHEFQKHGFCFAPSQEQQTPTSLAFSYFQTTLRIAQQLNTADETIKHWAEEGYEPSVSDLRSLYRNKVQVHCAFMDSDGTLLNRLLSIKSCWTGKDANNKAGSLVQTDCPDETRRGKNAVMCDDNRPVLLIHYSVP